MRLKLRLYVTGRTSPSQRALGNLRSLLDSELLSQYELEVIDILEYPELAERDRIIAIPTLVRHSPAPIRKIVGDLSDRNKLMTSLDLTPLPHIHPEHESEEER